MVDNRGEKLLSNVAPAFVYRPAVSQPGVCTQHHLACFCKAKWQVDWSKLAVVQTYVKEGDSSTKAASAEVQMDPASL